MDAQPHIRSRTITRSYMHSRAFTLRETMKQQNGFYGLGNLGSTDTLNYFSESIRPWKGRFAWGS